MNAALYARVSTQKQGESKSIDSQLLDLRSYTVRQGWVVTDEYLDVGISGTTTSRPELDRMMSDAEEKKFDVVLTWSFDRMGRSLQHLLEVLHHLKESDVRFVSFSQGVDTTTPTGELVYSILGAIAQFEREIIRERVKAGLRRAVAKGVRLGRRPKHGSDHDEIVRRIIIMANERIPYRAIVKETGLSKGRIAQILKAERVKRTSIVVSGCDCRLGPTAPAYEHEDFCAGAVVS